MSEFGYYIKTDLIRYHRTITQFVQVALSTHIKTNSENIEAAVKTIRIIGVKVKDVGRPERDKQRC